MSGRPTAAVDLYCVNHPSAETYLRCNKCGQPICPKCAVQTPVGYRCRDCINTQQRVFYADFRPIHYLVAAAVALPLGLVAGWLISSLGWYVIILGPLVGGGIANVTHWAIGRRRGQYTWLVVCGCIVVGTLPTGAMVLLSGGVMRLIWGIVYLVAAVGAAYAWLRPGRRR